MRIAVVHSFYSSAQPSGENRVVEDQVAALREAGHDVLLIARRTDEMAARSFYALGSAWRAASGFGGDPSAELRRFRPDVVHVHNLFPNLGTRWVAGWDGPVVATLHNYRAVCSNGSLFRDGRGCEECAGSANIGAIVHRCYRNSAMATTPVALGLNRRRRDVLRGASAIITTSEASDRILRRLIPEEVSSTVIPNFGAGDAAVPLPAGQRSGWVAMGRLSAEKGILSLAEGWPQHASLTVIGDGPERPLLTGLAPGRLITVEPSMPIDDLRRRLPGFVGLVFPSRWPDVSPQVVVEAMRVGLPVVALEGNVVAELVERTGSGVTYGSGRSLNDALAIVEQELGRFSARAVEVFETEWTRASWLARVEALYRSLR